MTLDKVTQGEVLETNAANFDCHYVLPEEAATQLGERSGLETRIAGAGR